MFDIEFLSLTLAQDTVLPSGPSTGETTGTGTGTVDSGSVPGTGAGTSQQQSPFGGPFLLIMLLLLGTMIIFSVLGQRRDRRKREALIGSIKKHDRVQTIGGVIGSVVEVKPDYVVLKVDESSNTRITFARSAIQQVLTASAEPVAGGKDAAK